MTAVIVTTLRFQEVGGEVSEFLSIFRDGLVYRIIIAF